MSYEHNYLRHNLEVQIQHLIYDKYPVAEKKQTYYESDAWVEMREFILEIKGEVCERCSKHTRLVHHKKGLFNSLDPYEDFEVLCSSCHNKHHIIIEKQ